MISTLVYEAGTHAAVRAVRLADNANLINPDKTAVNKVPGLSFKVNSLLGIFMYIVIAGCVAGLFMVAFKMATSYRNGEFGESAGKLAAVAGACIIVAAASGFVTFMVR